MEPKELLQETLFAEDEEKAYAIVDGAACEDLLQVMAEMEPESVCLYAGELEPDMEACAPYLIVLEKGHAFTEWLLTELPGKPWGIFIRTPATVRMLRKHFRTFLIVKNEQGESLYFRYYDPRVIRIFLPTCDSEQFEKFFGPVSSYIAEGEDHGFISYRYQDGKLQSRTLASLAEQGRQTA